ncbi:MAG: single-stranded DNA-binding protein [Candidatus Obscuribacterales bacterium]
MLPIWTKKKTMWVNVDAWNGLGDRVLQTITKGREVVVNGRPAMSTYSKNSDGTLNKTNKEPAPTKQRIATLNPNKSGMTRSHLAFHRIMPTNHQTQSTSIEGEQ